MKKIIVFALIACMMLTAVACNADNGQNDESTKETTVSATNDTTASADTTDDTTTDDTTDDTAEDTTESNAVAYTITVVDDEGNVVEGVAVQICVGDICKKPKKTGADGTVVFDIENEAGEDMAVQINSAPDGYEFSTEKTYITDGETEMTITVTKTAA